MVKIHLRKLESRWSWQASKSITVLGMDELRVYYKSLILDPTQNVVLETTNCFLVMKTYLRSNLIYANEETKCSPVHGINN